MTGSDRSLKKRIYTAVIGGSALVVLILWGGFIGITLLTLGLSLAMIQEFARFTLALPDQREKSYLLFSIVWLVQIFNFLIPSCEFGLVITVFLVLFSYYLFTAYRHADRALLDHFRELSASFFGLGYLLFVPLFLIRIRAFLGGERWILYYFLLVWTVDIAAFFVGKRFGKKKLYPSISPGKTVEGAIGGVVSSLIVSVCFKATSFVHLSLTAAILIPIFVGTFAQIGDLCESMIKRAYFVKDSGSILPGHGGFLDRFDSIVFTLPIMYACISSFT